MTFTLLHLCTTERIEIYDRRGMCGRKLDEGVQRVDTRGALYLEVACDGVTAPQGSLGVKEKV